MKETNQTDRTTDRLEGTIMIKEIDEEQFA